MTDDPAELPGGASDVNNIRLANVGGASPSNQFGIPTSFPAGLPVLGAGNTYNTYFAAASNATPDPSACAGTPCPTQTGSVDWPLAPATPPGGAQTLVPFGPPAAPITLPGLEPMPGLNPHTFVFLVVAPASP